MGIDEGHLRWMSRRGMLELDVLFERFIDRGGYAALSPADKTLFQLLLKESDPVLYSWLLGYKQPEPRFAKLVALITS